MSIQVWYSSHPIRVCSRLTRERCQPLLFRASLFSVFHSLQTIWDLASSVSAGTIWSFLLLRVPCRCIVHLSPMGLVCKRVYIKMRVRNQGLATLAFGGVSFQPHQDQLDPTLHVFKERDHGQGRYMVPHIKYTLQHTTYNSHPPIRKHKIRWSNPTRSNQSICKE